MCARCKGGQCGIVERAQAKTLDAIGFLMNLRDLQHEIACGMLLLWEEGRVVEKLPLDSQCQRALAPSFDLKVPEARSSSRPPIGIRYIPANHRPAGEL